MLWQPVLASVHEFSFRGRDGEEEFPQKLHQGEPASSETSSTSLPILLNQSATSSGLATLPLIKRSRVRLGESDGYFIPRTPSLITQHLILIDHKQIRTCSFCHISTLGFKSSNQNGASGRYLISPVIRPTSQPRSLQSLNLWLAKALVGTV